MRDALAYGFLGSFLDDPRLALFTDSERLRLLRLLRLAAVEELEGVATAYLPQDLAAVIGFGDDLAAFDDFLERLKVRNIVAIEAGSGARPRCV